MKSTELKKRLAASKIELLSVYSDAKAAALRIISAIEEFEKIWGEERDISVFSTPGRCEIIGNHTDHNGGLAIACAVDRDIIAIAAKNAVEKVRVYSCGYGECSVDIRNLPTPDGVEKHTGEAFVAGVMSAFLNEGLPCGGFDVYIESEITEGVGLSSSAAFEVTVANVNNHLYCDGAVGSVTLAKLSQYAENVYFGKPSGLMDQLSCTLGGFVRIDFENPSEPKIKKIRLPLSESGYELCLVNTGTSHAELNADYKAVSEEMQEVSRIFGRERLRGLGMDGIISKISEVREKLGDRAVMRAFHFIKENERVCRAAAALDSADYAELFSQIKESGRSSFEYLQNVYSPGNPKVQGLALALMLTEEFGKASAYRLHGGGFGGTVIAFIKDAYAEEYSRFMESVFGEGSVARLSVREVGACLLAE